MKGRPAEPRDRWGREPAVQRMRKVYALLEKGQRELLIRNRIPEFEPRLAQARRQARRLLEKGWTLAAEQGLDWNGETLKGVYEHLLATILARQGLMPTPAPGPGPGGPLIQGLLEREA